MENLLVIISFSLFSIVCLKIDGTNISVFFPFTFSLLEYFSHYGYFVLTALV